MDFYIVAIFAEKLYLAKQTSKHLTYHWRNVDPRFHNLHHVGSFTFSFQSKFTNGSFISYYVPVLFYWNHSSFPAVLTPSHIYTEPASLQSSVLPEKQTTVAQTPPVSWALHSLLPALSAPVASFNSISRCMTDDKYTAELHTEPCQHLVTLIPSNPYCRYVLWHISIHSSLFRSLLHYLDGS